MASLVNLALSTLGFAMSFGAFHHYQHLTECSSIDKLGIYVVATTGVFIMSYCFGKIHA